mmetsp:Transcript_33135/g.65604  ORF Transcript_33135/g.65604 Transcript_33135/m.65604 type:complete len:207 (+) Transcript_33135:336-956(+)
MRSRRSSSFLRRPGSGSSMFGSLPRTTALWVPKCPQSMLMRGRGRASLASQNFIMWESWHFACSATKNSGCFLRRCLWRKVLSLNSFLQKWKEQRALPSVSNKACPSTQVLLTLSSSLSISAAPASVAAFTTTSPPAAAASLHRTTASANASSSLVARRSSVSVVSPPAAAALSASIRSASRRRRCTVPPGSPDVSSPSVAAVRPV